MRVGSIVELSVAEIMSMWPSTIRIFIGFHLHCVGCPISPFHTLYDAAEEHGLEGEDLVAAITNEIERAKAGPAEDRRQSAAVGVDHAPAASVGLPPPVRRLPRR